MQSMGIKFLSGSRPAKPAADPLKKADPVIALHFPDCAGNGRLCHMQKLRRPGYTFRSINLDKNLHVPNRHHNPPFISKLI